MTAKLLPTIIILISAGAAIVYAFDGDWRRTGYWAGATLINYCVTY